jgi:hypothetical protein
LTGRIHPGNLLTSAAAELHFGFMRLEPFEACDRKRAAALRDDDRFARDKDLFLTYVMSTRRRTARRTRRRR